MHAKDPAAAAGLCWKEPASHTPASFPRCPVPTNTSTTCVKPEPGSERCVARAEQLQGIKGASFLPVLPRRGSTPPPPNPGALSCSRHGTNPCKDKTRRDWGSRWCHGPGERGSRRGEAAPVPMGLTAESIPCAGTAARQSTPGPQSR